MTTFQELVQKASTVAGDVAAKVKENAPVVASSIKDAAGDVADIASTAIAAGAARANEIKEERGSAQACETADDFDDEEIVVEVCDDEDIPHQAVYTEIPLS